MFSRSAGCQLVDIPSMDWQPDARLGIFSAIDLLAFQSFKWDSLGGPKVAVGRGVLGRVFAYPAGGVDGS